MSVPVAPAEPTPALGVAPPLEPLRAERSRRLPAGLATANRGLWAPALAVAALLCLITFYSGGGLALESLTATEMGLTIASGLVLAAAIVLAPARMRACGAWPAGLLLALALLSAVSVVWSVQPDGSWRDADRLLAYAGVFAAAVAVARLAPRQWPALLGGIVIASVVVCAYALATKSLPDHFAAANRYARLYEPFGYWNAIGLTAAMGAIACLWLGARRSGHALLGALAYPAMGLALLTLLLAYSRGALAALAVGVVLWLCVVPLRLRGAAVLIAGGAGAGAVAAWDFSQHALSSEGVSLAERSSAGHELGALILTMLVALTAVGVGVTFATGRRPPALAWRRRAGVALVALLALAAVAFAGALAHSRRGFTGTISHAFNSLTDTHAKVSNTPDRLTAIASVRAQYWDEALKVFKAHPALGAGAGGYEVARLRYRTGTLAVKHAHGFLVQTLADLGLVGLALSLALLACWMAAAGRATHPFDRRWTSWGTWLRLRAGERPGWRRLDAAERGRYGPERIGMLSMLCLVVVFGVHSLVDWTWYVPGDAVVALLCAGWLAGRGPLEAAQTGALARPGLREILASTRRPGYVRLSAAAAALALALLCAWSQWQPQRAEDAREEALALASSNPRAALDSAHAAASRDPLSVEPIFTLADVQAATGRSAAARATLQRAVRLQPSNPRTWLALGRFDVARDPRAAVHELEAAIYLDPQSISPAALASGQPEAIEIHNDYIDALRAAATVRSANAAPAPAAGAGRGAAALRSSRR